MIAAIMQPYFFPYIGYFQLMQKADIFVFYDNAQYMKGGWINRNRILTKNSSCWFTMPVLQASLTSMINRRTYDSKPDTVPGLKRKLTASYAKAPNYKRVSALIHRLLDYGDPNVATFNANLLEAVALGMGIKRTFIAASSIDLPDGASGQDKVIAICKAIGATEYVNPIGGQHLYSEKTFSAAGIHLNFLQPTPSPYQQLGAEHVPALSIIDVLMFNSIADSRAMLDQFRIVTPQPAAPT